MPQVYKTVRRGTGFLPLDAVLFDAYGEALNLFMGFGIF